MSDVLFPLSFPAIKHHGKVGNVNQQTMASELTLEINGRKRDILRYNCRFTGRYDITDL